MATQTAMLASEAWALLRVGVKGYKNNAQVALSTLQAGSVTTDFVFSMLDQLRTAIVSINAWKAVSGLDAFATAQGYPGTYSSDLTANAAAAQTCIDWVVTNFPSNSAYTINADGSRTPRSFTTGQTAGLQSTLSAFVASIG